MVCGWVRQGPHHVAEVNTNKVNKEWNLAVQNEGVRKEVCVQEKLVARSDRAVFDKGVVIDESQRFGKAMFIPNKTIRSSINMLKEHYFFAKWVEANILQKRWWIGGETNGAKRYASNFWLVTFCPSPHFKQSIMFETLLQMDIVGFYIKEWEPNFNPHRHEIDIMKAWVNLHNFPSKYQNEEVLRLIGNQLGTFIGLDKALLHGEMKAQVRIYVEISLSSECLEELEIITKEGKWFQAIDWDLLERKVPKFLKYKAINKALESNNGCLAESGSGAANKGQPQCLE